MSSDENTPDFDSMSPEELMAWMETLAERQGAEEGFTTTQRMEIADVDPSTVEDSGPGYIPYGMTEEEWAEKQAQEEADKAARIAARRAAQEQAALPETEEEEALPEPEMPEAALPSELESEEVAAAAAQAAAAGEIEFDSMSPEELMAWMETLAERQGAEEGFTTTQRMEIAEVDPSTVEDSGPGYIPYGMTEEEWAEKQAQEEADKAARIAARRAAQEQAALPEAEEEEALPEPEMPEAALPSELELEPEVEPEELEFELPELEETDLEATTEMASAIGGGEGMEWLESLAADQGGDFPEMDLSGLGAELESLELEGMSAEESDPESWLESLVQEQEEVSLEMPAESGEKEPETPLEPVGEPTADISDLTEEDVDPIEWLESLAKRQKPEADAEEFITDASLEIPTAEGGEDVPGYTDYTFERAEPSESVELPEFDAIDELDRVDVGDTDDPVAWLDSLASSQGAEAAPSFDDMDIEEEEEEIFDEIEEFEEAEEEPAAASRDEIIEKLNRAQDISAEEMKGWMDNLLDKGVARTDVPDYIDEDEEDEIVQAQIPDWLVEQVGAPPDLDSLEQEETPAEEEELPIDLDELAEPVDEAEMPDWLSDEVEAAVEEDVLPAEPVDEVEMPDWLSDEVTEPDAAELEDLFAEAAEAEEDAEETPAEPEAAEPASVDAMSTDEFLIDADDPWVEAFELERKEGLADLDTVPEWYAERLGEDQEAGQISAEAEAELEEVTLEPESELPAGEVEPLPDWLSEAEAEPAAEQPDISEVEATEAEAEPIAADLSWLEDTEQAPEAETAPAGDEIPDWLQDQVGADEEAEIVAEGETPDWLREAGVEEAEDIPDWLIESVEEEELPAFTPPAREYTPEPAPQMMAEPPAPVPVSDIDADATLQSAKEKFDSGDWEGGLVDYEAVIHVNAHLDAIVSDLETLVQKDAYKHNAAVYRVLGDCLMRQGRLQDALDTYRRALNLL